MYATPEDGLPGEWASFLGDLTRSARAPASLDVAWRVHDKTHLELAIDYPFEENATRYVWEAYFFVPESFRLAQTTYDKRQIYDDLLSYVRLAVPDFEFAELAGSCDPDRKDSLAADLRSTILHACGEVDGSPRSKLAVRRLRMFACFVRASGLDAQRRMLRDVAQATSPAEAGLAARAFVTVAGRALAGFRKIVREVELREVPSEVIVALRWVDEDMSLFIETLAATASVETHQRGSPDPDTPRAETPWSEVASALAAAAVAEARYRKSRGYPSVGHDEATPREVEHMEFRRHVLKRFTSSVLWLRHDVRDAARWILQGLYAVAAGVAMVVFAAFVTLRATQMQSYLAAYMVLLVVSYAAKDRLKAMLQTTFARWVEKRFADRAWAIRDEERGANIGVVKERAGFREFSKAPASVLEARRLTREHALEEYARPETVLWHQKRVHLGPRREGRFTSPVMTEIFRLNIDAWLAHTDDPNRTITFADPDEGVVCSVSARRVYNINVVYRLRREKGDDTPWRRIRAVVSRKGIERIDPIV